MEEGLILSVQRIEEIDGTYNALSLGPPYYYGEVALASCKDYWLYQQTVREGFQKKLTIVSL